MIFITRKLFYVSVCLMLLFGTIGIQPVYAAGIIVNTSDDTVISGDNKCTLREAIINANNDAQTSSDCTSGAGADVITINNSYVITLSSQLPAVTSTITITGDTILGTTIQANANTNTATYRVFRVSNTGNLTLNNLIIKNGECRASATCETSSNNGGGIYNQGTVTINNSELIGNNAASGGAIYNTGTLYVLGSTISSPDAANVNVFGAGIYNENSGTIVIANSTFSANDGDFGVAINSTGTLTIYNSTFANNTAQYSGIVTSSGSTSIKNTIFANYSSCESIDSSEADNTNLAMDTSCGNSVIKTLAQINLDTLASNGGIPRTHALLSGSHARDTGNATVCASAPVSNNSQNGATRPQGVGCDIGAFEEIIPITFADVPATAFGWAQIESIYTAGITGGCSTIPLNYCPSGTVTRAQMAVFLMKGINGSSYTPPPATGTVFLDVPSNSFAAAFIEAFSAEGITSGCGGGNYCPNGLVTRAQMAIFLLKAKHGSSYTPPTATGTIFNDVPSNAFGAAWIEQLASEGISSGCGGGNFCPNNSVTRDQMAIFLQRTFNLPLP